MEKKNINYLTVRFWLYPTILLCSLHSCYVLEVSYLHVCSVCYLSSCYVPAVPYHMVNLAFSLLSCYVLAVSYIPVMFRLFPTFLLSSCCILRSCSVMFSLFLTHFSRNIFNDNCFFLNYCKKYFEQEMIKEWLKIGQKRNIFLFFWP